mmetsp:Transcript_123607/g.395399  ORF Transcript_123607/g.395399 Transcript_123607/m.395399 type:complete len:238 (-) Transcript_123607:1300-2013(-)
MTSDQVAVEDPSVVELSPFDVHFSQDRIRSEFQDGRELSDTVGQIEAVARPTGTAAAAAEAEAEEMPGGWRALAASSCSASGVTSPAATESEPPALPPPLPPTSATSAWAALPAVEPADPWRPAPPTASTPLSEAVTSPTSRPPVPSTIRLAAAPLAAAPPDAAAANADSARPTSCWKWPGEGSHSTCGWPRPPTLRRAQAVAARATFTARSLFLRALPMPTARSPQCPPPTTMLVL